MLDEYDDSRENDDVMLATELVQKQVLEANDQVEIVERFISLCLNDNDWNWRNRLIYIYQKLKDNVKR